MTRRTWAAEPEVSDEAVRDATGRGAPFQRPGVALIALDPLGGIVP